MKDRQHRILRVKGGRVAWMNTSRIPDAYIPAAIRFVAREVDLDGVVVHFKQMGRHRRTYGTAYDAIHYSFNLNGLRRSEWKYLMIVTDGRGVDGGWFTTLAHEAKHIEQYRERLRRSEVSCNHFAAWLTKRWRASLPA